MTETEKIILSDVYVNKTPFSLELKKELRKIAVKGKYNLFLYQHLGDDFFRLNIKKLFEEKFGELHFIIQPGEVFLMDIGGKFGDGGHEVAAGLHGVGASVTSKCCFYYFFGFSYFVLSGKF